MTRLKKFSFFAVVLSVCLSFFFTACEGFFTDNDLDEKIKAAVDYAHMPYSRFTVSADSSAGTIIPSGQIQYKPTDYQNIEFKIKPEYEFLKWNFSYKMTSQTQDSPTLTVDNPDFWKDYLKITKETQSEPNDKGEITYTLQFQFVKALDNLLVEPLCAIKPKLERYPENKTKGQSREEELNFVFNTEIDKTTIFFSQAEIDAIEGVTQVLKNTNEDIYGYVKDDITYFKNIQILMGSYDLNVNSSYINITLKEDGKSLVLFTNGNNPVAFETPTAQIRVVFNAGLKNTKGASMKETSIPVTLNKETNRKSWIGVVTDKNAAIVNYNGYNTMEEQRVTFTETPAIQFLYWKVTSSASFPNSKNKVTVKIDPDEPKKLVFWGNDDISTAEEVQIIAVYEERPIYEWQFSSNTVYPKDSDIKIKFDKEINLDSFNNGYRIAIDGSSIISKFDEPILSQDKKTIIIKADKHNRLNISGNQTVSLTVPGTVYYSITEDDGKTYKVYLGQDTNLEYTINDSTADKAYIKFTVPSEYGEVLRYDVSGIKQANIGDEITLTYKEKTGYQFVGWNIEGDEDNVIQAVKSDTDSLTYTFNITDKAGLETDPVTITALTKERLQVVKVSPVTNGSDSVPKDKGIDIYFNHEPTPALCKQKIAIKCNGANVKDCFPIDNWTMNQETLDGKTVYRLTIPADRNNRVVVSGTAVMQVSFDANFYYADAGTLVYYGGEGWSHEYKVNEETTDKAILTFGTDSEQGILRNALNTEGYSIGRKLNIAFVPTDDYEFLYWETNNTTGTVSFDDKFQKNTNITINDIGEVTIYAKCAPKLAVTGIKVNGNAIVASNTYAKDSDITIEFNKAPPAGINLKNYLSISCGSTDIYSKYTPSLSGTTLTLTAKSNDRIQLSSTQVLTINLASDLYYENSDPLLTSRISMNGSYEASFNIDPETRQKAKVSVNNISDSNIGTIKDGTGNNFNQFGERELSKDDSFVLDFTSGADYEFIAWDVDDPDGNLSVSDVSNKRITVTVVDANQDNVSEITPVYAPKLAVESVDVNGIDIETTTGPYPKDSSLSFTFNAAPSPDINLRNYITVRCGTTEVSSKYAYSLSDKTLTITADPNNRLQISSDQVLTVSIDKSFYYTHASGKNISFNSSYNKSITINTTTNDKATVNVTNENSNAGSITSSVSGFAVGIASQYSKDQSFTLNYALDPAYEFIEWSVDGTASNIQLTSTTSPTTTVTIVDSESGTATIKAVTAEKLKVNSVTVNDEDYSTTDTYPKDSVIVLTFNKPIPTDILLSRYISLTCNNIPGVYDQYNVAVNGSKITFTPNSRLDIPSTKSLVLTIDQSLYYKYSTTKNITLAETYSKAIQLTTETVQKASVKVTNGNSNAGSITSSVSGLTVGTAKDYSKDQTFTLTYSPNSAYEFIKWEISGTSTNVQLSSTTSPTTTVTIVDSASGTATINAVTAEKLKVSSFKITNNYGTIIPASGFVYPKDSDIVIEFNQAPENETKVIDNISIICNGQDVSGYFTPRLSDNVITFEASSNRIPVTATSTVYVTVKDGIYYTSGNKKVYMANQQQYTYQIDKTTRQQAHVYISSPSKYGTIYKADGTPFTNGAAYYNKDEVLNLKFVPNDDYVFVDWKITGLDDENAEDPDATYDADCLDNVNVNAPRSTNISVTIQDAKEGLVYIVPQCTPYIAVKEVCINGQTFLPLKDYEKDSWIIIQFNHRLPAETNGVDPIQSKIKLYYRAVGTANDITDNYNYSRQEDPEGTRVTFTADKTKLVDVASTDVIFISVAKDISYEYSYSNSTEKMQITMKNKYEEYFRVNSKTTQQYKIIKAASSSTTATSDQIPEASELLEIYPYREDGLYNWGEVVTVKFPRATQNYYTKKDVNNGSSDKYKRNGWQILKNTVGGSYINGEIIETSDDTDYYSVSFKIYSAIGGAPNPSIQTLIFVDTNPQVKSIYPVTTHETKTYSCDTPIKINFTHNVNNNSVNFSSTGNLRVVVPNTSSDSLNDGFDDITEYYDLDLSEGDDNTLIIRPKFALIDQFPYKINRHYMQNNNGVDVLIGYERTSEVTIYVLAEMDGTNSIRGNTTSTSSNVGNLLFKNIPCSLADKIFEKTINTKKYCCIPMKINNSISNPVLSISDSSRIVSSQTGTTVGDLIPNTEFFISYPNNPKLKINGTYQNFPTTLMTTDRLLFAYSYAEETAGEWSKNEALMSGTVSISFTKLYDYNPSTGKTNTSVQVVFGDMTEMETKAFSFWYDFGYLNDPDNFSGFSRYIDLSTLGYTYTSTNWPILRVDVTITHKAFASPYTTFYYIIYGK